MGHWPFGVRASICALISVWPLPQRPTTDRRASRRSSSSAIASEHKVPNGKSTVIKFNRIYAAASR
jgi:hypothetical protein